jgi:hypothetical protein
MQPLFFFEEEGAIRSCFFSFLLFSFHGTKRSGKKNTKERKKKQKCLCLSLSNISTVVVEMKEQGEPPEQ